MAKYFGGAKATKVYPKRIQKASVGIELDKGQALDVMLALAAYLKSAESSNKRLIMTAFKSKINKKGEVPLTFIAGKSKG
jgi:hypothetical protein